MTGNQSLGRVVVLAVHLSNTLLLLAALTLTAVLLGSRQRWTKLHLRTREAAIGAIGLAATLVVGVSGSLAALGDTLFPASSLRAAFAQDLDAASPWLLRLRGVHPASAIVAAAFVVWLLIRGRAVETRPLAKVVAWLSLCSSCSASRTCFSLPRPGCRSCIFSALTFTG